MAKEVEPPGVDGHLVTLVFTDIQGSTALWEQHAEAIRAALVLHDELLRRAMADHGGYEMRTEGDSFKVAFADPAAAVRWCMAVQTGLLELDWPSELLGHSDAAEVRGADDALLHRGPRVRMGAHIGRPDCVPHPVTRRMDYFGPMVNTTARIANAPSGGQVVVSSAVWEAVKGPLADDPIDVVDLGEHRLKGVNAPQRLFQLLPPELARRTFPPLSLASAPRTNLQARTDVYIGRAGTIEAIDAAVGEGARLVTLLGPGGIGKTRTLVEFGMRHLDDWRGGVWLADLSEAQTIGDILTSVAAAIRLPLTVGQTSLDAVFAIGKALQVMGDVVLLLDNFEQITEHGPATIGAWLTAAPDTRFITSSRQPLNLAGERRIELDPLAGTDGVELFVERAREVNATFASTEADLEAISGIVEQLDGLPLAIELAASRAQVLGPQQILDRLSQRFRLLKKKGPVSRQATLRGAIDWSWELLSDEERSALAQCAVFRHGFTMEAADEIVELAEGWPLDVLQQLVEKSLLFTRDTSDGKRLGLYTSIHAYASERLDELGLRAATESRHCDYFAERGREWADATEGPRDLETLPRILAEAENLVAAHRYALERDSAKAVLPVLALAITLNTSGPATWFLDLAHAAAEAAEGEVEPELECRIRLVRGMALRLAGRREPAQADFEEALRLAREHGLRGREAEALFHLHITVHRDPNDGDDGVGPLLREAIEVSRAADRPDIEGKCVTMSSFIHMRQGDFEKVIEVTTRGAALLRERGSRIDYAWVRRVTGGMLAWAGRPDEGIPISLEVADVYREAGARTNFGNVAAGLAIAYAESNQLDNAERWRDEARETLLPTGAAGLIAMCDLTEGYLELARFRADRTGEEHLERARAIAAAAERPASDGSPPIIERSMMAHNTWERLTVAIKRDAG